MFISPIGGPTDVKKPELTEVAETNGATETTKIPSAAQKEARRYQYLFQSTPLHGNKSLLRNVLNLVNKFLQQVMGRDFPAKQTPAADQEQAPKRVRGVADRMPRLVDPYNPEPSRDSIFLGEARDYPAAVIGIEYKNTTKPVFYEGNQIVARHLNLECDEPSLPGTLILNDGTRLPVEIMIITAV